MEDSPQFPIPMDLTAVPDGFHAYAVMTLVVIALVLFASERVPLASSSLLILVALSLLFEVFPYTGSSGETIRASQLFLGFGHQALVAVCALMIPARRWYAPARSIRSAASWRAGGRIGRC